QRSGDRYRMADPGHNHKRKRRQLAAAGCQNAGRRCRTSSLGRLGNHMIIVDNALKQRAAAGKPIQVGMIGAGFMGRGLANQILNSVPGMRLAAIANRTVAQAARAYSEAGAPAPKEVTSPNELNDAIRRNNYAISVDLAVVCLVVGIVVIFEVRGA